MSEKSFSQSFQARFRQADPAGILFFAEVFQLAHDAYEDFVEHLGFSHREWFENPEWAVPIRHSEAEHLKPLRPPEKYDIRVLVERIGESSFSLQYLIGKGQDLYCKVTLVHTFIDKKKRAKENIPTKIRDALTSYQRNNIEA